MSWNYRIIEDDTVEPHQFGVYEVGYDADKNPQWCSAEPEKVYDESASFVVAMLIEMLTDCVHQPVLLMSEMKQRWKETAEQWGHEIKTVSQLRQFSSLDDLFANLNSEDET